MDQVVSKRAKLSSLGQHLHAYNSNNGCQHPDPHQLKAVTRTYSQTTG